MTEEYCTVKTSLLTLSHLRDLRPHIIQQLKEDIAKGFNPARLITVMRDSGHYLVVDGNHRLQAAIELGIKELPCVVRKGDPLTIAAKCNEEEDTYAKQDLFDYLGYIKTSRDAGDTQEIIGGKLGWSREKISQYCILLDGVATEVLEFVKPHQEGRVAGDATNVANFTEGWFRNSGIYDLKDENEEESKEYQKKFIDWFVDEERCKAAGKKITAKSGSLKAIRSQLRIVREELFQDVPEERRQDIIDAVERGEYTDKTLREVIARENEGAKNRYFFGVDANTELAKLGDNSVDLVVTDPPWGVDFKPSRPTGKPEFDTSPDVILAYLDKTFAEVKRVCKENSHVYVFFPTTNYCAFYKILSKYFKVYEIPLVWVKNNHNPCDFKERYASQYETIFFCKVNPEKSRPLNEPVSSDILQFDRVNGEDKEHDTQKPIELLQYLIENSSGVGEVVLDPFMGSGSALLAAAKSGRYFIGFEKEKRYEPVFKRELGVIQNE